jgi:hypothetical protein
MENKQEEGKNKKMSMINSNKCNDIQINKKKTNPTTTFPIIVISLPE